MTAPTAIRGVDTGLFHGPFRTLSMWFTADPHDSTSDDRLDAEARYHECQRDTEDRIAADEYDHRGLGAFGSAY